MRKPMSNLVSGRQLVTAVLFTAGLLWAVNKGPDAGGYTATDSTVYSFIDPAGGGGSPSVLTGSDDDGALLTLPFSFQFYGQSYTMVCVSSNGLAYFVTDQTFCDSAAQKADFANTDLTTTVLPGDRPAIAPFWMDLTFAPAGAGAVYYQTVGTAPNRQFIIEWYNAIPAGTLSPVTFEAILNETTNNVLFQYQTVSLGSGNAASLGATATVGIRNTAGNTNGQALQWSYSRPVLSNSYAILFGAPSSTATSVNTIDTSPSGITVTIDGTDTATPATVRWVPGTTHTLSVTASQTSGGTQTAFTSWSPTGTTAQISVQAQNTGISYIATFATQYLLTTTATPASEGSVNGNGTFYPANQQVTITATPIAGFAFKGFTGALTGTTNPQTLIMNGPKQLVATFGTSFACSVSSGTSASVTDVQGFINQALGIASAANDINGDHVVNVVDVQIVINAVLNLGCTE
jgi:hypothetical protein